MEWYHVLLVVFAVVIAGLYIYKRLTGVDILKMIVMSRPVLVALSSQIEAVSKIFPSETLRVIKHVQDASVEATELAEKAWLMGNLEKEERNPFAKEAAYDLLETIGIQITPQIEAIVAGVIEMTCMVLPHGVEPEKTEE